MSWRRVRDVLSVSAMAALLLFAVACGGADVEPAAAEAPADMAPVLDGSVPINDLPNPYSSIDGWGKLPDGREWGSTPGSTSTRMAASGLSTGVAATAAPGRTSTRL